MFEKGNTCNRATGNRNVKNSYEWTSALKKVNADKKGKNKSRTLFKLAEKVWDMALNGNIHAIREIGDRVEGKAMQLNVNEETQFIVLIGPESTKITFEGEYETAEDNAPIQRLEA